MGMTIRRSVVVVEHNPRWCDEFIAAAGEIRAVTDALVAIHHIGSTSIAGICAKPIIDMLGVVAQLDDADGAVQHLAALAYIGMGEYGIPSRRYFRRDDSAGVRTHHLHVFAVGSPHIARHLAFRDYLREHPEVAARYSELKRQLAAAHPHDIEAYMDGKDAFIKQVEAAALAWWANEHRA